jgi:regulator of RNase E activity RraA
MPTYWNTDEELFAAAKREPMPALLGDVMDGIGLRHQFLPPYLQPLHHNMVVLGRAMPVLEADCYEEAPEARKNTLLSRPFGLMLQALDELRLNEVYVCTGGSPRYALWGELMSTRALRCGAAGAVLDGYSRDTGGILALEFPTFARGRYAQDQGPRGKVIDYRVAIEMDGVRIQPGDIVFGDLDGVCVVPRKAEEEAFAGAFEKARGEKTVRKALEDGMTAQEAFERFGIL